MNALAKRPLLSRTVLASALGLALLWVPPAHGQMGGGNLPEAGSLVRATPAPVRIQRGGMAAVNVTLRIEPGWHINANPPNPDYMIPTEVSLASGFGVSARKPRYPAPRPLKVGFEQSELLVYDGEVVVSLPLRAAGDAVPGVHSLQGSLRFQACNDQVCLAPATVKFPMTVTVAGGAATTQPEAPDSQAAGTTGTPPDAGAGTPPSSSTPPPDATPPPVPGFTTSAPPPGTARAGALNNPIARALDRGGWVAFLTLFVSGLLLNLTPCVYPMLGVTVSIFGARRSTPPLRVVGLALLYVLGMALMYSSLGVAAALTGGLFGGFLQSPVVQVGIGLLLVALALSMFGLYEIQLPPALLSRLGGTSATNAAGVFLSGLVVGVFAAPCIGPPIVALLAVVGARGDPWFGFTSFFVLSMGLGAPYLVLGTFSNLIQALPRSGEWMVWVKKVFGVILLALGAVYALLALAPEWSVWVTPAALLLGGLYLGFLEKSADQRPGFRWIKRLGGAVAVASGLFIVATAPNEGIAFEAFTQEALEASLKDGAPVMLDFTADWCAPCHELERYTFSDRRVREAARSFRAFKVDLTRYDSPESDRWRRRYGISGVPTVLFLAKDGGELRAARVEGFLSPEQFLERMRYAVREGQQVASE